MVHGGVAVELGDRGQHAEGVGREEDHDVGGALGAALGHRARDELDRVGHAAVLGERGVEVVRLARLRVDHHVLAHGAEADGVPDLRLGLRRDVDGLGVAAALDVEDLVLGPAVLVVADEQAPLGGRERGLARAGEAEEDRGAVRGGVHVAGAVHREHVVLDGHQVVHDREDRLLDLTAVLGAHHEDHALLEVDEDGGLGVGAEDLRVELEGGRGHHAEVGVAEVAQLLLVRAHEHLVDEERLARELADGDDLAGVAAVGPRQAVHHEEAALGEVTDDLALDLLVALDAKGHVDAAPGDLVVHVGRVHDEAVLGRAARVLPRDDGERARARELALAALDGRLYEDRGRRVDDGLLLGVRDAVACEFLDDHAYLLRTARGRRER